MNLYRLSLTLASVLLSATALAAPLTLDRPIELKNGNAKAKKLLEQFNETRDIVRDGPFQLGLVDLDGDGLNEMIVMAASSSQCGSGGCATVVLKQQAGKMLILLSQQMPSTLGLAVEKLGNYRALLALDEKGGIASIVKPGSPWHGQQMAYGLGMGSKAPQAQATPPADDSAPAAAPAESGSHNIEMLGFRLGMSVDEVRATMKKTGLVFSQTDGGERANQVNGVPPIERLHFIVTRSPTLGIVTFFFGAPPGPHRLIRISRGHYAEGMPQAPKLNLVQLQNALTDKYGAPVLTPASREALGLWQGQWVWRPDGSRADPAQYKFCTAHLALWPGGNGLAPPQKTLQHNPECGQVLQVNVEAKNGVVWVMNISATDVAGTLAANDAANSYSRDTVGRFNEQQRNKAAQNKPQL